MGKNNQNETTLTGLLTKEPTEENYDEVVDILAELAERTYKDYKFLIAKSSDETQQGHFLQITHNYDEDPETHKKLFSKAMDYGVNQRELQQKFAERVANGDVLPLGDGVTVIINDGTGQLATGVSPINSGLENGEITFIVTFVQNKNYEKWAENNLPSEDESNE